MKNSELIKLLLNEIKKDLRIIVREEIQKAVQRKPDRTDEQTVAHGRKLSELTNFTTTTAVEDKQFKFTKNPVLNKILNQTAKTPRQASSQVPVQLNEFTEEDVPLEENTLNFTSGDAQHFNKKELLHGGGQQTKLVVPTGKNPDALPEHLKKIFSRDYSKLVDKMSQNSHKKAR